jgi:alpha-N-arabinofuranosidase
MSQSSKADIYLDTNRQISPISPLLFSGFAEHMGRGIYGGIYDPQLPHADECGLRKDMLAPLEDATYIEETYQENASQ